MGGNVALNELTTAQVASPSTFQHALHNARQAIFAASTMALLLADAIMTYAPRSP